MEYDKKYYHYPFDIFCVSSEMEKQMVVEKMGYSPGEVKVTGLSRFDELLENPAPKRKILLMPTWRNGFIMKKHFWSLRIIKNTGHLSTTKSFIKCWTIMT
ncbi:hypothetical protein [Sinobaca sp. H24]|uniref:hypothetical protein n=1 Tax=Sinobaca sp. H24 TaxID=2923376 RepID=UPI00207A06FA|nr:hypothetical protein [Sinobaca sp. H24]